MYGEESPDTFSCGSRSKNVAGNTRRFILAKVMKRGASRDAYVERYKASPDRKLFERVRFSNDQETSSWGDLRGETAKSLRACKAVLRRSMRCERYRSSYCASESRKRVRATVLLGI